ncbi:hypothetical protein D3C83_183250 [compost metagenome]
MQKANVGQRFGRFFAIGACIHEDGAADGGRNAGGKLEPREILFCCFYAEKRKAVAGAYLHRIS